MVAAAQKPAEGTVAAVLGAIALLFGASGVFAQLQDSLNTIWEVQPKPGRGIRGMIRDRFLSFAMVLGIGFLLMVSLILSAVLAALGAWMSSVLPGPEILMQVAHFVISFGVIVLLFAAIFKLLPDVEIGWTDVWIGAIATSFLFTLGKYALGLYLGRSAVASAYGAAGSLVIVLLWVYYSAQILFLGAEFTQAYAHMYGSQVRPSPNAVPVTQRARERQGLHQGGRQRFETTDLRPGEVRTSPEDGRRQSGH
jgi:membrane protein